MRDRQYKRCGGCNNQLNVNSPELFCGSCRHTQEDRIAFAELRARVEHLGEIEDLRDAVLFLLDQLKLP